MTELKTEPLATPTETPEAPEPDGTRPLRASRTSRTSPVSPTHVRKSPVKWVLYAAAAFFGLLALELLAQVPRWIKQSHLRRVQHVVDTVTPTSVVAHCGQPLEDVTKDLYPMISRRMTFHSAKAGSGKVILFFSRTSEENSEWLYSSMRDDSGVTSYNTPDEQMAALPCLAATK